jgi:hypothetical protein
MKVHTSRTGYNMTDCNGDVLEVCSKRLVTFVFPDFRFIQKKKKLMNGNHGIPPFGVN